ncbi:helix-turn-helix domain-containing protein [Paraburkholderia sp. DD10]|uniref:helix-turn-helix domain-containing protein n=1 Tax=Paraburkholderia sp. DD10 TaxID=3409691 RepID=UPI003BA0B085
MPMSPARPASPRPGVEATSPRRPNLARRLLPRSMKAIRTTQAAKPAKARGNGAPRSRTADNVTELPVAERPGADKSTESGALTRGLTILSAVIGAARPLTLIEIGETVGLSSSTCHRLLQTLTQAGYIYRDTSNRYYPTPRAVCPLAIDHPLNLLRRDTGDTLKTLQHEYGASAGLIVFVEAISRCRGGG